MSDWSKRYLCPDGACVGVIGPDGKCKVCGKQASDVSLQSSGQASDDAEQDADEQDDEDQTDDQDDGDDQDEELAVDESSGSDPDWNQRQLCPDGACVGVIHDGKCNVCGRSAA